MAGYGSRLLERFGLSRPSQGSPGVESLNKPDGGTTYKYQLGKNTGANPKTVGGYQGYNVEDFSSNKENKS